VSPAYLEIYSQERNQTIVTGVGDLDSVCVYSKNIFSYVGNLQ